MGEERKLVQIKLTDQARTGLRQYAQERGINVTVLVEAIGEMLESGHHVIDQSAVDLALEIKRSREYRDY